MDTKKIGAFLKQCRKEKNLTQEQLAEKFVYPQEPFPDGRRAQICRTSVFWSNWQITTTWI